MPNSRDICIDDRFKIKFRRLQNPLEPTKEETSTMPHSASVDMQPDSTMKVSYQQWVQSVCTAWGWTRKCILTMPSDFQYWFIDTWIPKWYIYYTIFILADNPMRIDGVIKPKPNLLKQIFFVFLTLWMTYKRSKQHGYMLLLNMVAFSKNQSTNVLLKLFSYKYRGSVLCSGCY